MFLFKRRWILTTLLVLFAAAVMIRLGIWQLDRLAGKRAAIAQAQAALASPPIPITGAENDPSSSLDAQAYRDRSASAKGAYDFDHEILLKNKFYGNQPGYHLLTPLRIEGSEGAVLVDRGWISLDDAAPEKLTRFHEPGAQTISGRIEPEDRRPDDAELPTAAEREWYRIDIAGVQKQTPYPLLPFYIALTPSEDFPGPPLRNPPEIIMDEGPHLGYAIQWFLFAIVVPIVYVFQVRKMERAEAQPDQASPPPPSAA